MNKEEHNDNDWKDLAPTLSSLQKKQVLKVPENYFEDLPERITDRIMTEETVSESVWEKIARIFRPRVAVPFALGAIAIIALVWTIGKTDVNSTSDQLAFNDISGEELFEELSSTDWIQEEATLLSDEPSEFFSFEENIETSETIIEAEEDVEDLFEEEFEVEGTDEIIDIEDYFEWDDDFEDYMDY